MADLPTKVLIESENALFWYIPDWFLEEKELYEDLLKNIPWEQMTGSIAGKEYKVPRLTYHVGDNEINKYKSYGGNKIAFHSWYPKLKEMRDHLQECLDVKLDSCLLNYYIDGKSSIAAHSDRESMGRNAATVGISLGESRKFIWRKIGVKRTKGMIKEIRDGVTYVKCPDGTMHSISFETKGGDLYMMSGMIHELWKHEIPKTKEEKGGRISLTFRQLMS